MDFILLAALGAMCGAVLGLWVGMARGRPGLGLALGLLGAVPVAVLAAAIGAETALALIVRGAPETLPTALALLKALTMAAPALAGLLLGALCPRAAPPEDWRARIEAEEAHRAAVRAKLDGGSAGAGRAEPTLARPDWRPKAK